MRAHWRHLANAIELVLPSARLSPQPKRQIDQFSHVCTADGKVLSGMPGHVFFRRNNCPFSWGIWALCSTCFLGPSQVHNPNGISIGSAIFAQLIAVSLCCTICCPFPPSNYPFPWEIWTPFLPRFFRLICALNPNGISITPAVFAGFISVTNRPTHLQTMLLA